LSNKIFLHPDVDASFEKIGGLMTAEAVSDAGAQSAATMLEPVRRWIAPSEALRRVLAREQAKREQVYGVPAGNGARQ